MQFSITNETKLLEIENHLSTNQYLSGEDKPNFQDSDIFLQLKNQKKVPDQSKYPNLFTWYGWINLFEPQLVQSWNKKYIEEQSKQQQQTLQKEEAKVEVNQKQPAPEDVDLFGSDDNEEETQKAKEERKKKIVEDAQKNKEKPKKTKVEKTICFLDICGYEVEQDLNELYKNIRNEIVMDGLVWTEKYELQEVAYGIKKLRVSCVVEDNKISIDDLIEKITTKWEDQIQSIDISAMQKL